MLIGHHCSQSTFPSSDTLPQLVHLNKYYDIPAELTQRNLNLNPIYSSLLIPPSQFIKKSRFIWDKTSSEVPPIKFYLHFLT